MFARYWTSFYSLIKTSLLNTIDCLLFTQTFFHGGNYLCVMFKGCFMF